MAPKKCIERMIKTHELTFGQKPTVNVHSPLEKNDHPELNDSESLDRKGIEQHQSLIGQLQWAISIECFDISTAVATMSGFRAAPRRGHLDRVKRICGCLARMKSAVIRLQTHLPDCSDIPEQQQDWYSTYGNVREMIPNDAPMPLGKAVRLMHYVDANPLHDALTGRSMMGILHFVNGTPIGWHAKK